MVIGLALAKLADGFCPPCELYVESTILKLFSRAILWAALVCLVAVFLHVTDLRLRPVFPRRTPSPILATPSPSATLPVDISNLQPVLPFPDLVKKIRPSVVQILGYKSHMLVKSGSGFFITSFQVATNFRVIEGVDAVFLKYSDGSERQVSGLFENYSQGADVAILMIENGGHGPLVLAGFVPQAGEHVYVLGNPEALEGSVSDGIVSARRRDEYGVWLQITAPISRRSSGSPVFDDAGIVVGIASMALKNGQNLNFARSAGMLRAMLASNPVSVIDFTVLEKQLTEKEEAAFRDDPDQRMVSIALARKDWAGAISLLNKQRQKYPRVTSIADTLSFTLDQRALELAVLGDVKDALNAAELGFK